MTCWNKTIHFYGYFHIDAEHSRSERANSTSEPKATYLLLSEHVKVLDFARERERERESE